MSRNDARDEEDLRTFVTGRPRWRITRGASAWAYAERTVTIPLVGEWSLLAWPAKHVTNGHWCAMVQTPKGGDVVDEWHASYDDVIERLRLTERALRLLQKIAESPNFDWAVLSAHSLLFGDLYSLARLLRIPHFPEEGTLQESIVRTVFKRLGRVR